MTADGDPAQQNARLSAALERDLPDDFGQLVVYQSQRVADAHSALQDAQRIFVVVERAVWLLVVLGPLLLAAALLLAADRRRAGLLLALGIGATMVVLRAAVRRVVEESPSVALTPGGKAAIGSIVGGASTSLLRLSAVIVLAATIVVLGLIAAGRWRRADLVVAVAVIVGVTAFALVGARVWGVVAGVVLGIAIPLLAHRVWPSPPAGSAEQVHADA